MSFLEKKIGNFNAFVPFVHLILFYLIFSVSPRYKEIKFSQAHTNSLNNTHLRVENNQTKALSNKLAIDLMKNDLSYLVKSDSDIYITLDSEGKIIGYKPLVINMPNYWNSQVTKQMLMKNNLFSLFYEKDQVVSFRLSSLI